MQWVEDFSIRQPDIESSQFLSPKPFDEIMTDQPDMVFEFPFFQIEGILENTYILYF